MTKTPSYLPSLTTFGLIVVVTLIVVAGSINPAYAQANGFQVIDTAFNKVLTFLTGGFARTAATIAVAVAGYLALTSRIPWMMCFSIVVGIAFIFGGAQIVQTLSGQGGV